MIKVILTDIEGTTTDIHFVHKELFPYSREKVGSYLQKNQNKPEIKTVIQEIRNNLADPHADLAKITAQIIQWIDQDIKIGVLKTLQGYIWQEGFETGAFKAHLYQDAYDNLVKWHEQSISLYVYSSGSIKAQQLLFQYSIYGDLRYLFNGYFDTQMGGKKESLSYRNVLNELNISGEEVMFLSDVVAELDAAKQNGIQTVFVNREPVAQDSHGHQMVTNFNEISTLLVVK